MESNYQSIYAAENFNKMKIKSKEKLKEFLDTAREIAANNSNTNIKSLLKAIEIKKINNGDYKLLINNINARALEYVKMEFEKLKEKKETLENKEINNYIEEISNINIDNLPIVYLLAIASKNNIDSNDLKEINDIVLLENKKLIYLKDLVNLFGNKIKTIIESLLKELADDKIKILDNNTMPIIGLSDKELKILKEETKKFIIEKIKKSKEDFQDYLSKMDNIKYDSDLPLLYLLIILREFISDEDIYMYCINIELADDIIKLLFSDTKIYNIYIDESGEIIANKKFLIGGYFIENINFNYWKEKSKILFDNIKGKYDSRISNKENIYHRNTIEDNDIKNSITYDVFNFVKINDGKFICIYEDKVKNDLFARQHYVTILSELIVYTVRKIIIEKRINLIDEKLLLIIKIASRTYEDKYDNITFKFKDIEKFLTEAVNCKIEVSEILNKWKSDSDKYLTKERYIEKLDISPVIYDSIEQVKIKYGLNTNNIDYKILGFEMASRSPDLAIADYFCNSYLNFSYNKLQSPIKNFKYMIHTDIKYNPFSSEIDLYFETQDYYNILKSIIMYKKMKSSNKSALFVKEYSKELVKNMIKKLKETDKKNRYVIAALKSILENIEYESNYLRNYSDIIDSYDILIDLAKENILTNNESLNKAIIFTINTEKLAVYNHSDNDEKAYEVIEENNNYKYDVLKSIDFIDRVILFDNISSILYWYKYNPKASIKVLNETLADSNIKAEDRAKLYGTLGQSYHIKYYITNNESDLTNAENNFYKAMEYFNDNNFEIIREYSYLQNAAVSAKNEDKFLGYTEAYLNLISDDYKKESTLNSKINKYLSKYNKDKGYEFFVIRLLRYCNTFKISEKSKEIADLLISNKRYFIEDNIKSSEDVDIQKEYTLLLYKYNNEEVNTEYLEKCYGFMIDKKGTFNKMRMLSLYIIEILIGKEYNINKALEIIEKLSNTSDGYKNTFNTLLLTKDSMIDKKEWASKVRDKLYM